MARSPGHEKYPNHKVREQRIRDRVTVRANGEVVADSRNVIKVDEDENPERYYFPRADVKLDRLKRTDTTTKCPFKGLAHYYTIGAGDEELKDAVWTYEDPYDEHRTLKDRLAFYDDKNPLIELSKSP